MITVETAESIAGLMADQPVEGNLLERAVQETLNEFPQKSEADITIMLSDDAQLHELNRQFLGIDAPTDVLSFPEDYIDPDTGLPYLGDIIISYPRAIAQAETGHHLVRDELQLLVVHGVLHLLGYDHVEEEDKKAMWAVQAEILARLGSSLTYPEDE